MTWNKQYGIMHDRNAVAQKIHDHFNGLLELIDPFEQDGKNVTVRCTVCENFWTIRYYSLMHNNKGCKYCNIKKRNQETASKKTKTHEQYVSELKNTYGNEYEVTGHYKNRRTKIRVKHICGYEWDTWPNNLLYYGKGCPICNKYSKGERYFREKLIELNIDFKEQYSFDDLRGKKKPLLFDFALFSNGILKCLIEYNGLQHYKPVKIWGGSQKFNVQQEYDTLKSEYCKAHNIKLFVIYHNYINPSLIHKEIEEILKECNYYV